MKTNKLIILAGLDDEEAATRFVGISWCRDPATNEGVPLLDFGPIAARQEKWQHPLYVRVAAHWPLSIYQLYPFQR